MVVLDTNIIIDHLRQRLKSESLLDRLSAKMAKENLAIAVITVQELYEGRSTRKIKEEGFLVAMLAPLKFLAYTYETAKLAGEIVRDSKSSLEFADAAIAATAIVNNAELLTLNKKHFVGIKWLELL